MNNGDALNLILSELKNINTRFDKLEGEVRELRCEVSELKNEVGSVKDEVNNIKDDLKNFRKETKDNFEVVNMQIVITQKFVLNNKNRIEAVEVATLDNLKETRN